jgi:hypothetical protein
MSTIWRRVTIDHRVQKRSSKGTGPKMGPVRDFGKKVPVLIGKKVPVPWPVFEGTIRGGSSVENTSQVGSLPEEEKPCRDAKTLRENSPRKRCCGLDVSA